MLDTSTMKLNAASKALDFIIEQAIIGVGTGSTVNFFIEVLANYRPGITCVSSSDATTELLLDHSFNVVELSEVNELPIYVDGADAYNNLKQLTKGGGGALTREKILANAAQQFICIVDNSKRPSILGTFPIPIEVIPMSKSYVAHEVIKLGGSPSYRENFVTDNGNYILDVHNWEINEPIAMEETLNNIPGVVCNGIFAKRRADHIVVGNEFGAEILS